MIRRILIWLRQLIDPLWVPPEEMEAAKRDLEERVEMDRKAKERADAANRH